MGFNMGQVFTPQTLGLVLEQQRMQRAGNAGMSRKIHYPELGEGDAFKHAQLKATVDSDKADRELKRELALIQQNIANATNDEDKRRWESEFAAKQDAATQRGTEFEFEKEYKTKGLGVDERRVGAAEKANELRAAEQFGAGDPSAPGVGSKAAQRTAGVQGTAASVEERKARTQEIMGRIEGTLPDQIDRAKRTTIMGRHQGFLEQVQAAKSPRELYRLAIDAVKASRDPVTGLLDVEGGQASLSRMMGSLWQIAQERGPEFAEAFMSGFNEESFRGSAEDAVRGNQESIRAGQAADASKPYVPSSRQPGNLGDAAAAMEEIRRRAREQAAGARPPSPVGR